MKIWNYVFLAVGLSILFEMSGMFTTGGILSLIGFSVVGGQFIFDFTISGFRDAVLGSSGILIGITAGVIIGAFTRSSPENYIILPFITGTLGLFIQAFANIIIFSIANSSAWITAIIILIMGPLMVLYIIAMVEFFRGTD